MTDRIDSISDIFEETFFVETIKNKIERGEELTEEDKERLLNTIYKIATNNIRDTKMYELNKTSTKVALGAVSIIFRLSGKKGKDLSAATKALRIGFKDYAANQKELIKGITLTDKNPITENFNTLIAQYDATGKFDDFLLDLYDEIEELINSYKRNSSSTVISNSVQGMKETRSEIVSLSKKYIRR